MTKFLPAEAAEFVSKQTLRSKVIRRLNQAIGQIVINCKINKTLMFDNDEYIVWMSGFWNHPNFQSACRNIVLHKTQGWRGVQQILEEDENTSHPTYPTLISLLTVTFEEFVLRLEDPVLSNDKDHIVVPLTTVLSNRSIGIKDEVFLGTQDRVFRGKQSGVHPPTLTTSANDFPSDAVVDFDFCDYEDNSVLAGPNNVSDAVFDAMAVRAIKNSGVIPTRLIYAPPHSGKTYLQGTFELGLVEDTDNWRKWPDDVPAYIVTNRHELLRSFKQSVAIIPSRREFKRRCELRGLPYRSKWYVDAWTSARKAQPNCIIIRSDRWLVDLKDNIFAAFGLLSERKPNVFTAFSDHG